MPRFNPESKQSTDAASVIAGEYGAYPSGRDPVRPCNPRLLSGLLLALPLVAGLSTLAPASAYAAQLSFDPASDFVDEGDGSITLSVVLDSFVDDYGGPCTVDATVVATGGDVVEGVDFTIPNPNISIFYDDPIFGGPFTDTVTINIIDNTVFGPPSKSIELGFDNISATPGGDASCESISGGTGKVTIFDDEDPPPPSLSPSSIAFSGPSGGPFSPSEQTVRVTSCLDAIVDLESLPPWLDVSISGGTCDSGTNDFDFEFSVNNEADTLSPGAYSGSVAISTMSLNESEFDRLLNVTLTVETTNDPPVCTIAEPDRAVTIAAGESVDFSGSVDDAEDGPLTPQWRFPGGDPSSSSLDSVSVSYPDRGVFTATLAGVDSRGARCNASRSILVTAPTVSIVATDSVARPDVDGEFTVSLTQPVNGPATINYSVGGSAVPGVDYQALPGNLTIPAGQTSAPIPVVVIDNPEADGDRDVVLTLTDGSFSDGALALDLPLGSPSTATVTLIDEDVEDQPPVCAISSPPGDVTITVGQSVNFGGSVNDAEDGPLTPQWSFPGGEPASSTDGSVSVSYATVGEFTATLSGTDSAGQSCPPTTRRVTVVETANNPPICTITSPAGNQTIAVGDSLNVAGEVIDPDGDAVSIQWSINPTPGVDTSQADPTSATLGQLTFTEPGTYAVDLNASDARGAPCGFDRLTVVVEDEAPEFVLSVGIVQPGADPNIPTGETVSFLAEANSTPPGADITLDWSFGQGASPSSASGPGPHAVTYTNAGDAAFTATATVTATAPDAQSATASRAVTVLPDTLPDPRIVLSTDTVRSDESVQFNVEIDFPDPNTLLYSWTFQDSQPSTSTAINPVVVFSSSGVKQVTLTVTDPATGSSRSVTLTVEVEQSLDEITEEIVELLTPFSNGSPAQQSLIRTIATVCPSGSAAGTQLQADCDALIEAAALGDPSVSTALGLINPDQTSAPRDAALTGVETQLVNIFSRLTALRLGTVGGIELGGLHLDLDGTRISGQQMQSLLEAMGGGASADESGFSRLGVFVSGRISRGERDATDRVEGFDYRIYGLTLGADYRLRDDLILGAALGYSRNKTDVDGSRGTLDSNGYSATFYGTWYSTESFFLDGSLTYGRGDYDQGRVLDFTLPTQVPVNQTFDARFDGDYLGLALNTGYEFRREALTVIPTLRLQYIRTDIDGYRERRNDPAAPGAGWAVEIDDQRFTSFTSSLGVQASYALSQSWGILQPFAGIEWIHEFEGSDDPVTGRFLDDANGNTFVLPVDEKDSNYFNLGLGVSAQFIQGASGFVNYQRVLGYDNLEHYSINAGVRFEF